MLQVVKPDFEIKVGIKDGKVVSLDWSEMLGFEGTYCNQTTAKKIHKKVRKYLKKV